MEDAKCISLKRSVANEKGAASFPCPKCGKHVITRSRNAREIVARYTCPLCGFTGPN